MPCKGTQTLQKARRDDILACAPNILIAHRGFDTFGQIAQKLGLGTTTLRAHASNEAELIRLLCHTNLDAIFAAVCQHATRQADPPNPLTAMAQAVLASAAAHPARHRVYLLHRALLTTLQRQALKTRRANIENCFHFALHSIAPHKPFAALRDPARLLVSQLLHTPLWWPSDTPTHQTDWLANQIGTLAGLPSPVMKKVA